MLEVVALIAVRGDGEYVANALRHLIENNIAYAIVDNGMDDTGRAVLGRREFRRDLVDIVDLPYGGAFDLRQQILTKQGLADTLAADWFIHLDVDEIMHSHVEGESLNAAIARLDTQGATAVNFDEFVMLPVETDYVADAVHGQAMRHYYFFEPTEKRLMRAFKKTADLRLVPRVHTLDSAAGSGHAVFGDNLRISPEFFALRHHIVRDQAHAYRKYAHRRFSDAEIIEGWHGNRIGIPQQDFRLPTADRLKVLARPDARGFDRSAPTKLHYWHWPQPADQLQPSTA